MTVDEVVHLPLGLYMLLERDFHLDPINPPLSRMIPALSLLVARPAFDPKPGQGHWTIGLWFMTDNSEGYHEIYVLGRSVVIIMGVTLGLLVFRWTRSLYGWPAALVALFLLSFSPSLLAHSHLVTVDLAGALGFVVTLYAAWRFFERPSAIRAVAVGGSFAIAVLLKLSSLSLLVVIGVLVGIRAQFERHAPVGASAPGGVKLYAFAGVAALFTLNLFYAFEGTLRPLGEIDLARDGILIRLASAYPWLRLPLPAPFLEGIDLAVSGAERQDTLYFLAGRESTSGWWHYHLVGFLLKTPIPFLVASAAAVIEWIRGRSGGLRDYCVFVGALAVFVVNAIFNPVNIGVRHILAAEPLLAIVAAPVLTRWILPTARSGRFASGASFLALALLAWHAAGTLRVAPRYLQYFNEFAGGSERGHSWLVDSNIDWGQDLIRLSEYIRDRRLESVSLAYFGSVHPRVYGIRFEPLVEGQSHGIAVVSASFLMGRPYSMWYSTDRTVQAPPHAFEWLRRYEPIGRVGAMFVYDLP